MTIKTACEFARNFARYSIEMAVRVLMEAGLALNDAARYALAALRSLRTVQA